MTQIPDNKLKEILLADGLVSEAVFNSAAEEASRLGNTVAETLVSRNIITDDYFRTVAARYLNVPLMELEESKIDINVLNLLPNKKEPYPLREEKMDPYRLLWRTQTT